MGLDGEGAEEAEDAVEIEPTALPAGTVSCPRESWAEMQAAVRAVLPLVKSMNFASSRRWLFELEPEVELRQRTEMAASGSHPRLLGKKIDRTQNTSLGLSFLVFCRPNS